MKKLMWLSAGSVLIVSVSRWAFTGSPVGPSSLGIPLSARVMSATVGGQGARYKCNTIAQCPYVGCPDPPGVYRDLDQYRVCGYTGNLQDSCSNNATFYCNRDHYHDKVCQNYWHTDLPSYSKCIST